MRPAEGASHSAVVPLGLWAGLLQDGASVSDSFGLNGWEIPWERGQRKQHPGVVRQL